MPSKQSFPNLDIAKLFMAFLVVEIHTKPFIDFHSKTISQIVSSVDCIAVPFFFIASGFLCFRGISPSDFRESSSAAANRTRKTIHKQFLLYIIWTVLLLPIALFGTYLKGWEAGKAAWMLIRGVLFVGNNTLTWPLWYLLASVVAFAIIYFLLRKGVSSKVIIISSGCLLLLGFALKEAMSWDNAPAGIAVFTNLYSTIFGTTRNGLLRASFT